MRIKLQAGPIWHRLKAFTGSQRQWLLLCCLLGAVGNALLFYFVPQPGYDHAANLVAVGGVGKRDAHKCADSKPEGAIRH